MTGNCRSRLAPPRTSARPKTLAVGMAVRRHLAQGIDRGRDRSADSQPKRGVMTAGWAASGSPRSSSLPSMSIRWRGLLDPALNSGPFKSETRTPPDAGPAGFLRACGGCGYCIELMPNMFPSVSWHRDTQPNSPIENFGLTSFPPAAATRASSTEQSSALK